MPNPGLYNVIRGPIHNPGLEYPNPGVPSTKQKGVLRIPSETLRKGAKGQSLCNNVLWSLRQAFRRSNTVTSQSGLSDFRYPGLVDPRVS